MSKTTRKHARRRNIQGLEAQAQIIQAAEKVLRQDGFHGFTTRRVALACGISSGNLAYHFPTKQELLDALVSSVLRRYEEEYQLRQEQFKQDPNSAFDSALRWLIVDTFQDDTGELFVELWVHAKHSNTGEKTIGGLYELGFRLLEEMMAQAYPESSPDQRRRAARVLVTFIEGSTVLRQSSAFIDMDLEEVVQSALTIVSSLLGHG